MRILINDFAGHSLQVALSRELARTGHTVLHTFFAGNNTPMGPMVRLSGDPNGFDVAGLSIAGTFKKHSLWSRRQSDREYGHVVAETLERFQPQVVLSANMPLVSQEILLNSARKVGAGFVFWVQDVYSEAIRFVIRKKRLPLSDTAAAYFRRIERDLLIESDKVVCVAPGFQTLLESWGIPQDKIIVIENWAPINEIPERPKLNPWSEVNGTGAGFTFVYSGTLGMKHKPELLLALAKRIQAWSDVSLVVIAQGSGADWLRANRGNIPDSVLRIMDFQPYDQVPNVLGSGDVLIVLLDSACGGFAVPSKTLTYMCAGRPILLASPPENLTNEIITGSASGVSVPSEDEDAFIEAATHLYLDRLLRTSLGQNARAYAERMFDIQRIGERFTAIFKQALYAPKHAEKDNSADGHFGLRRRWIPWKSFSKTA
jgi:colanic acid biosynthesis glycosyl transferase WcaI